MIALTVGSAIVLVGIYGYASIQCLHPVTPRMTGWNSSVISESDTALPVAKDRRKQQRTLAALTKSDVHYGQ
jgi:hypothetical protein